MVKEYHEVLDDAHDMAEKVGAATPDIAWLYLEDAYYWPNPHYKGEPVCHPEAGPASKDPGSWNPQLKTPSLRERFKEHKK